MNFIAHFHLAWPHEGLIAGGLEGDFYKGPLRGDIAWDVEQGIRLHRAIDAYTDAHPALARARAQFPAELRRYAGVLQDLSFDYYLSKHWDQFSDMPLTTFNEGIYRVLRDRMVHLSAPSRAMADRLVQYDILNRYDDWATVTATAERIGERFKRYNPFVGIETTLTPLRESLERSFLDFYPDLQGFSESMYHSLGPSGR
jgi:acyl carrier protein phosphodiesterase